MSLSAAWGFRVPLSPSLFILVLFLLALLHFPFGFFQEEKGLKPKCSWENPKGRRQKAKRKKKEERRKESKKERREKVEKKYKNDEIEAKKRFYHNNNIYIYSFD